MIKETHGKMKQFIKKRIKFRKFPNKKSINVYVLEEANKLLNQKIQYSVLDGESDDTTSEEDEEQGYKRQK